MGIGKLICCEGDNTSFIWKSPYEDFNMFSQIIVHENQEAIFVRSGKIMDILGPGRYRLDTKNVPILTKAAHVFTGISIIHCEIYFVNKNVQMALKWGLDSKIRFIEPTSGVPVEIGVSGELSLQVADSLTLLVKNIGTLKGVAWNETGKGFAKSLKEAFRPLITAAVKSYLPVVIREFNIDIIAIDEQTDLISRELKKKINSGFLEYGLDIIDFYILTILLPEDDESFKELKKLHTVDLQKKTAAAEADVLAAKAQSQKAAEAAEADKEERIQCPNCRKFVPVGKFCNNCGVRLQSKCPNCGAALKPESRFCSECGMKIV